MQYRITKNRILLDKNTMYKFDNRLKNISIEWIDIKYAIKT